MIGNVYPFKDTGYSMVEEGAIQNESLKLRVEKIFLVDPQGQVIGEARDLAEAKNKLAAMVDVE